MARSGGVGRSATADGVGGLACWPTRSFAALRSGLFSSRKLSELIHPRLPALWMVDGPEALNLFFHIVVCQPSG